MSAEVLHLFYIVLSIYFGATLAVSAVAKLYKVEQFQVVLIHQRLLPTPIIRYVAWGLPLVELLLCLWLIAGIAHQAASFSISLLFLLFLIFETTLVATRKGSSCGCYGVFFRQTSDWTTVITAWILFLLSVGYCLLSSSVIAIDSWVRPLLLLIVGLPLGFLLIQVVRYRRKYKFFVGYV